MMCRHPCFTCGGAPGLSGTLKCSMGHCGRHYHWKCLVANPLARVCLAGERFQMAPLLPALDQCGATITASFLGLPALQISVSGRRAKCSLHYCFQCGASGDGIPMVQVRMP